MARPEETPSRMEPCPPGETSPAILGHVASLSGATHALGAAEMLFLALFAAT